MMGKVHRLVFLLAYRLKSNASRIVVEDFDGIGDATGQIIGFVGLAALFAYVAIADLRTGITVVSAALFVAAVYNLVVHGLALWYYATEPTEIAAEWWVVGDD